MSKNNLEVNREQRTITMSRIFDAPREHIWKIVTDPDLVPLWWGPGNLTTTVDKMDFKVGGTWRYIQKDANGVEFAFHGVYKEIDAPHRLISTSEFELMAGHISTETLTLDELPDGKTKMTVRTSLDTLEDLEGMIQSGMENGAVESWDRLEALLMKV
ncbi:MAG: SRPBCC family protein [Anaerolineales bacterium]